MICSNSKISTLNDVELYSEGLSKTFKSLSIVKDISQPIDKDFNIFIYWIGDNVNYKHSVVEELVIIVMW